MQFDAAVANHFVLDGSRIYGGVDLLLHLLLGVCF